MNCDSYKKNGVINSILSFLPVRTHEGTAPEWQTLTQRLSSLVYNREHEIGVSFHTFCNNLQLNYRHIMQSLEPTVKKNEPSQGKQQMSWHNNPWIYRTHYDISGILICTGEGHTPTNF